MDSLRDIANQIARGGQTMEYKPLGIIMTDMRDKEANLPVTTRKMRKTRDTSFVLLIAALFVVLVINTVASVRVSIDVSYLDVCCLPTTGILGSTYL